ncbi:MAG: hypothetical protein JWR26_873 [Pedosphaera sp.]|nr:hypothetical protein [Pedosphaera sp.]
MILKAAKVFLISLFLAMAANGWLASAQETPPSEYQVKAAFLYNFAKFVEWPAGTFSATNQPIVIGIIGDNPFGPDLTNPDKYRPINGRPLVLKQISSPKDPELKRCQMVFVCRPEMKRFAEIQETLKAASVLTISDVEHGSRSGVMINFVMEDSRVRFEIDDGAARKAGLKISSKLLNLAKKRDQ